MNIRALPGYVIVQFRPWEHSGMIEIPDSIQPPSVEADVIHDGDGEIEPGAVVIVSRLDGEYFDYQGVRYCRVKKASLLMQKL